MTSARPPQVPEGVAWTVHHDALICAYSVENGEELIANVFYARDIPEDQEAQRLKAHTIAAAPALVEALKRQMLGTGHVQHCGWFFGTRRTCIKKCAQARAALKLARGGGS